MAHTLPLRSPNHSPTQGGFGWRVGIAFTLIYLLLLWPAAYGNPMWVFLPWLVAGGGLTVYRPRAGFLIFVMTWFFRYSIGENSGVYPPDIILLLLSGAVLVSVLASGQRFTMRTPLNRAAVVWMGLFLLSMTNATNLYPAVKNWLRHAELFVLFLALVHVLDRRLIVQGITLFMVLCGLMSITNIALFVQSGGNLRAFGPAAVLFSGYLAIAVPFATAMFLFERRRGRAALWAGLILLFILAQVANQSRGAMLQLLSGCGFAVLLGSLAQRVRALKAIRRRLALLTVAGVVFALLALSVAGPAIVHSLARYDTAHSGDVNTLSIRAALWAAAIEMLKAHPIIGVGPAQTLTLSQYIPDSRFDFNLVVHEGIGIHNSMLRYLAECGILGSLALWYLLWKTLSLGRGMIRSRMRDDDLKWALGLWCAVFVIVTRFLYEGHLFYSVSGMTTVTFAAMLYNWRRLSPDDAAEPAAVTGGG